MHRLHGFELNVSCPNTKAGGLEFGADPDGASRGRDGRARGDAAAAVREALADAGRYRRRPRARAVDAGADAITVVNTMPGLVIDVERRRPALGLWHRRCERAGIASRGRAGDVEGREGA